MIAFTSKVLYTPLDKIDRPVVLVENGSILRLGPCGSVEMPLNTGVMNFGDCILAPGLVDIHIHGAAGQDVMQADADGQNTIEQFLVRHGVTSYYPTTVAAPVEDTLAALERLAGAIDSARADGARDSGRARPLGIHLEGPFLSHARRGVHRAEDLLPPTLNNFNKFWQAARGYIRLMTIAPELEGATEVIAEANKLGVCVSLGHSDADLNSAREGVAAGARHATHTFNAMRPLNHREPGILGEILTNPQVTADVIADGVHVDPTMVELLLKAKGPESIVLITDAISAAGMPDGRYQLGSFEVELKDGKCVSNGSLAGSILTMDEAVRNVMRFAKWDLQRTLRAATLNPARVAGARKKGILEPGADADFVVLTPDGEVRATIVKGVVIQ